LIYIFVFQLIAIQYNKLKFKTAINNINICFYEFLFLYLLVE
jgi:hypothetical protein